MDILSGGKGLLERIDIGDMRRQPQLDLAIVGGEDDMPGRSNNGLPDLTSDLGPDWKILQIRFGR